MKELFSSLLFEIYLSSVYLYQVIAHFMLWNVLLLLYHSTFEDSIKLYQSDFSRQHTTTKSLWQPSLSSYFSFMHLWINYNSFASVSTEQGSSAPSVSLECLTRGEPATWQLFSWIWQKQKRTTVGAQSYFRPLLMSHLLIIYQSKSRG